MHHPPARRRKKRGKNVFGTVMKILGGGADEKTT
jgi:hypothetical protein